MAARSLDAAVSDLCNAVVPILQQSLIQTKSGTLQHATALLDTINSSFSVPRTLDCTSNASPVSQCVDIERLLSCVPHLQLRLISDIPLLNAGGDALYWCCRLLRSTYACFRSLRLQKLLPSNADYFRKLTKTTCECLSRLSHTTTADEDLLLILLRIAFACTSGFPSQLLDIDVVSRSLTPYFDHPRTDVRIAARNTAQFLIQEDPALSAKREFILTKNDVRDILLASGKSMPVSAVLRLLHSFSIIPRNRGIIKAEGGFLFAVSIACCSQREMETKLAFSVMKSLSVEVNEDPVQEGPALITAPQHLGVKIPSFPVLSSLREKLESIQLPLAPKTCADVGSLLQEASRYEITLEAIDNLVHQPLLQIIAIVQEEWRDFEQVKLAAILVSSLFLFWMEFTAKGNVAGPISPKLLESFQMILCSLRFPGRACHLSVSKSASQAVSSLLALVIKILDFPLPSAIVSAEVLLDSIEQFLVSSPSEVRVLALVAASKVYTSIDRGTRICKQMRVTVEELRMIVSHISDQQGLPVSSASLLTLVLTLASVSDENRQLFREVDVIQMFTSLPQSIPDIASFQRELARCLGPEHIELALGKVTEVVLESPSVSLPHSDGEDVTSHTSISTALVEYLPKLAHLAEQFKNTLLEEQITNRDTFVALADLLADVEETLTTPCDTSVDPKPCQRLSHTIIGIMCELLPAVQRTRDKQLMKWNNFILFSLWGCVLLLDRKYGVDLTNQLMSELVDPVLQAIVLFNQEEVHEFSLRCLDLCLTILEDMLYDVCASLFDPDLLRVIGKTVTDSRVIAVEWLRPKVQLILCSAINQEQVERMHLSLTVTSKLITEYIKPSFASAAHDFKSMQVLLRKTIALARLPSNRLLMRQNGLLEVLEVTSESFAGSEVEDQLAELICTLLSDDQPEHQDSSPDHTSEVHATNLPIGHETSSVHMSSLEELIQCTSGSNGTKPPSLHVRLHAEHILSLFSMASQQFEQMLCQPDAVVSVEYLINSTDRLIGVYTMYDEHEGDCAAMATFGEQLLRLSRQHLPNLACISFKAMKDFYSDSMTDAERSLYVTVLMKYLQILHGCVECWSRMQASVQQALVDHGIFHLLLNELHTASTTTLVQRDCVYAGLSTLYNVVLDPRLAVRFRIVITKKLLVDFLSMQDAGIRFLAKFSMSCLHAVLSAKERSSLILDESEVSMIARCLNGVDKFFGGQQALLVTVDNLARCPENWELFADAGVVHTLVGVALIEEGSLQLCALSTILNMLPEEDIPDGGDWNNKSGRGKKLLTLEPVDGRVAKLIVAMPAFVTMINNCLPEDECFDICHVIRILTRQTDCPDTCITDVSVLYRLGRYRDCWRFCKVLFSKGGLSPIDCHQVLLHQAKSAYHNYNKEIGEKIEQESQMPGFEYKKLMQNYCKRRVLPVIDALTSLRETDRKPHVPAACFADGSQGISRHLFDEEAVRMLDKALLDFLVFNNSDVRTCLLCHKRSKKLVFSHYIPKSIIQEFVRALGLDPGANIFVFSPGHLTPDWQFKSASKVAFSMLCDTCDNQILSKDERLFKNRIFNQVYNRQMVLSYSMACSLSYQQYLYRFAAGLLFRCIAPLYSGVCSEIGNFASLHSIMQACREVVLHPDTFDSTRLEVYLFFLPLQLPSSLSPVAGWEIYVQKTLSPYCAYTLLQPGEPMVPKRLYCCMVKIGVFLFVSPVDYELKDHLAKCYKSSQIQFKEGSFVLHVPDDDRRREMIPRRLYWSLMGWAKLEVSLTKSVEFAMDPLAKIKNPQVRSQLGIMARAKTCAQGSHSQFTVANLLPPGFSLNFDKRGTLPEQVIEVPHGHVVLLHHSFPAVGGSRCFAALARLEYDSPATKKSIGTSQVKYQPVVYSVLSRPYILIYMQNPDTGEIVKVGFCIDEQLYHVVGPLPGGPAQSKGSEHLQGVIQHVPRMVCGLLRSKGFRNLGSLLFWHDSLQHMRQTEDGDKLRISCVLDTKCQEKCLYCDMRCDFCFTPTLIRHKYGKFPDVGVVQSCTESCTNALFAGTIDHSLEEMKGKKGQFVPVGHEELLRGCFSIESNYATGLKTTVIFSLCQSISVADDHDSPFNVPTGIKYIKLWQRSLHRPYLVEYVVDEQFNPTAMLDVTPNCVSMPVFSPGEEAEMMHQFHRMLVRIGIPYHVTLM